MTATPLDLFGDPVELTAALVDVPSVSGTEAPLADLVEQALTALPHLTVLRDGNNLIARTELGRPARILLAGPPSEMYGRCDEAMRNAGFPR